MNAKITTPIEPQTEKSFNTPMMRRILASSFIGSSIEYYDFILFATAASLVFDKVFFAGMDPVVSLIASFGTLAIGYLLRPLGGLVFGHYGDILGRKKVLVITMMMMGIASVGIGLLPTPAQIGAFAPLLLVFLRMVQGFAVGGEWGGAMLLAAEHSPNKNRGFAASFATMGGPFGAVLATLMVSLMTVLPGDQFLAWGWRVPFLASVVLIVVGLIIRLKVTEAPVFKELVKEGERKKVPFFTLIRQSPRNLVIGIVAGLSMYWCQAILTVWLVAYAVGGGLNPTDVLNIKAVAAALTVVFMALSARMSDSVGRRPVLIWTGIAGAVLAFPFLLMIQSGSFWLVATALILGNGVLQGMLFGPFGGFVAELFPTQTRYTGSSLSFQGAALFGAGFTPILATALVALAGGSIWLLGIAWSLVFLISATVVYITKDKRNTDLASIQ